MNASLHMDDVGAKHVRREQTLFGNLNLQRQEVLTKILAFDKYSLYGLCLITNHIRKFSHTLIIPHTYSSLSTVSLWQLNIEHRGQIIVLSTTFYCHSHPLILFKMSESFSALRRIRQSKSSKSYIGTTDSTTSTSVADFTQAISKNLSQIESNARHAANAFNDMYKPLPASTEVRTSITSGRGIWMKGCVVSGTPRLIMLSCCPLNL